MELAALWVSFAATAAGIASAVIAWFARGDALKAQSRADEAQREAAISEGRSASAAETIARIQSTIFDGPPWVVAWFGGESYLLTNTSPVDAHDVTIHGEPTGVDLEPAGTMPRTVGAKSALKFMHSPSMATPWERDIVVTWRRSDTAEALEWRHPIPAKPR